MSKRSKTGMFELFLCCWMTYLTTYLCRVNFSRAMIAINREMGISIDNLGVVGALFFLVYACGQLINGFIGDRMHPVKFIIIALAGTAACNIGVSFCHSFVPMLILWGINGYFQSIFWSTIIRLLALRITPEKRSSVSSGISSAMPAGYLVSWCLLGNLFADQPMSLFFLMPAAIALLMIIAWCAYGRKLKRQDADFTPPTARMPLKESIRCIFDNKLWVLMPLCVLHGVVKEGVSFWAPQLMAQEFSMRGTAGALSIALLPLANLAGMFLSKRLLRHNPLIVILFMTSFIAFAGLAMVFGNSTLLYIAMITLISGLSYGNNTVLMSFIPMQYTRQNMVATLVGLFDFSSYIGAAISTYALGRVLENAGFSPLPYIWLGAAAVMLVIDVVALRCLPIGKFKTKAALERGMI